jgi:multicomponent Na+:H+ antiporter subunit C
MGSLLWGYLPYCAAAWVFLWGAYGVATSRNLVHLVMCVALCQTSTYLVLLAVGYRKGGTAPVLVDAPPGAPVVDPVVQALCLTDIVVEATVMALMLALAVQAHRRRGTLDPAQLCAMKG